MLVGHVAARRRIVARDRYGENLANHVADRVEAIDLERTHAENSQERHGRGNQSLRPAGEQPFGAVGAFENFNPESLEPFHDLADADFYNQRRRGLARGERGDARVLKSVGGEFDGRQ